MDSIKFVIFWFEKRKRTKNCNVSKIFRRLFKTCTFKIVQSEVILTWPYSSPDCRYLAIVHPLHIHQQLCKRCRITITFIWAFTLTCQLPIYLMFQGIVNFGDCKLNITYIKFHGPVALVQFLGAFDPRRVSNLPYNFFDSGFEFIPGANPGLTWKPLVQKISVGNAWKCQNRKNGPKNLFFFKKWA